MSDESRDFYTTRHEGVAQALAYFTETAAAVAICKDEAAYQTLMDIEIRVYQNPSMVGRGEYLMARAGSRYLR